MLVRLLSEEEIVRLYHSHMEVDFPKEELKPLFVIQKLYEMGAYEALGCYEGDNLIGYALFEVIENNKYALLDYYAVCRDYRNAGIGSVFLKKLLERYREWHGVVAEVEKPGDGRDEEEVSIRSRRISFYERLGFRHVPGVDYSLFGVPYAILLHSAAEALPLPEDMVPVLEEFHKIIWQGGMFDEHIVIKAE